MIELRVRAEEQGDAAAIREVVRLAFGRDDEADLVDALRAGGWNRISVVAQQGSEVVGHVLLSAITIDSPEHSLPALALAPLAVLPAYQRRGIGWALVREGLRQAQADGHEIVLVLGDPHYYSRFGFSSALAANLSSPFSGEAFQALALAAGALDGVAGEVRYAPPFAAF